MQDISILDYQAHTKKLADLERLISKVAGRINPREVVQLKRSLTAIEPIQAACKSTGNDALDSTSS